MYYQIRTCPVLHLRENRVSRPYLIVKRSFFFRRLMMHDRVTLRYVRRKSQRKVQQTKEILSRKPL